MPRRLAVLREVKPDAVVHCAAWTAVDAAEDEENQPKVRAINASGTANIAEVCKELDCKMVYISTDYVFNGQGETPWQPDCKDYAPLNFTDRPSWRASWRSAADWRSISSSASRGYLGKMARILSRLC